MYNKTDNDGNSDTKIQKYELNIWALARPSIIVTKELRYQTSIFIKIRSLFR